MLDSHPPSRTNFRGVQTNFLALNLHTCDKFKKRIREVCFSFQGGFSKLYRIYRKIVNSFQGDF